MKQIYKTGDIKIFSKKIEKEDVAAFDSGEVHPVYATFALARDAEWAGRLFVLDMKDDDEEGIGTIITVRHNSPALIGEEVIFESKIIKIDGNEIISTYDAKIGDRLIADGMQGQKILKKTKIEKIFSELKEKV
jgi:fluoroacetyl-CoA thioesterase